MTHIQVIRYLKTHHLLLVVRIQVRYSEVTNASNPGSIFVSATFFYPQRELPFYESHQSYNILKYKSTASKDSVV